jgi:hypothetical protein
MSQTGQERLRLSACYPNGCRPRKSKIRISAEKSGRSRLTYQLLSSAPTLGSTHTTNERSSQRIESFEAFDLACAARFLGKPQMGTSGWWNAEKYIIEDAFVILAHPDCRDPS